MPSDILTWLIIVFFAGIALVVVLWVPVCCLLYHLQKPKDRYSKGHPDYWLHSMAESICDTTTLGGFKAKYRLKASLERVNDAEFLNGAMLEPQNYNEVVRTFDSQCVRALWFPSGRWFLRYTWSAFGSPGLWTYRFDTKSGERREVLDPNCSDLIVAAKTVASAADRGDVYHGCKITLHQIEKVIDDATIEENYRMITQEQHAKAEEYLEYQRVKEAAVIKALKLRLDLAQQSTVHKGSSVTITISVVGTTVTINWELGSTPTRDGDRLLGFRKDDGFFIDDEDNLDDTGKHGQPIVDSASNGSSTDHPSPGRTHYYTFFLRKRKKEGLNHKYSLVKFPITVPAANDLAALKAMLESAQKAISRENEKREKLGTLLDRVNYKMEIEKKLVLTAKQMIDQINTDPKFSPEERQALVDAVNEETAWVRRQL
jgi:hypothetical protein